MFCLSNIIISTALIFLSFFYLYDYSTDYEYSVYKDNDYAISSPEDYTYKEIGLKMKEDYEKFKNMNNDVAAVIDIPNVCYQPVVFTGDQSYLRKGLDGKWSLPGTLFLGAYTDGNFNDNAIIYGHHMHDGTMFASLKLYNEETFFKSNEPIKVYDGKKLRFYKPYASLIVTDGKEKVHYKGREGAERDKVYSDIYRRSKVKMEDGLAPDYSKDMLFLQTCEYVYNGARHLVGSYLVKEVEI